MTFLAKFKKISSLWSRAQINPANGKATTIPILNPYDVYGRVFTLSYLGFMVAFLSWFAFPPLMGIIKVDMKLTQAEINNSNVVGLCSTLLARFILGPLCDRYGPRVVMAGTLLVGAVPTAFVPLVNNVSGIYAIRFFIGFLGGTFVPCQFWTSVFFDKSIVGRACALTGGWGNAGGGIAFFVMPAITRGLERNGYTTHHAWRYSFDLCPLIIIVVVATLILLFGRDCPEGRWSERTQSIDLLNGEKEKFKQPVDHKYGHSTANRHQQTQSTMHPRISANNKTPHVDEESAIEPYSLNPVRTMGSRLAPINTAVSRLSRIGAPELEPISDPRSIIEAPTFSSFLKVSFSLPTMLTALCYATTFGGELAIESILSALYASQSKKLGENWSNTLASDWGSMMGLLNVVFRPLGGYVSDVLYRRFQTPLVKKFWMLTCGFLMGVFLLYIGLYKKISMPGLIVSMAFMSLFMEMGNGANYSLVPHINPHHTGIVSGTTGAFGNVGGILLSLAFRFSSHADGSTDYMSAMWYLGVTIMGVNGLCSLFPLGSDDQY